MGHQLEYMRLLGRTWIQFPAAILGSPLLPVTPALVGSDVSGLIGNLHIYAHNQK